jgi:hypothetical protein
VDEAAQLAAASVGTANPRPVDADSLRQLVRAAYQGREP